jgi:hypothetical protein
MKAVIAADEQINYMPSEEDTNEKNDSQTAPRSHG